MTLQKELNCKHCNHTWKYKGKQKYYTNCPNCMYKVNIKKRGIKSGKTQC